MSQLLRDVLVLLCFAVHGGGGHHALAASETRYSEVKPEIHQELNVTVLLL